MVRLFVFMLSFIFMNPVFNQSTKDNTKEMEKVKIEVWSDVVCPYCYLGKKKLEKAINKLNMEDQVEVIWRSYQLNPDFPMGKSAPSIDHLTESVGYSRTQVESMCNQLKEAGVAYGLDYRFDQAMTVNTFDLHRIIQWSKSLNKSNELGEDFMKSHFTEGKDLSVTETIIEVVAQAGLDTKKASQILSSDAYGSMVKEDIERAKKLGVRGVPFFLINEKVVISGAQDDQVFEKSLSRALK